MAEHDATGAGEQLWEDPAAGDDSGELLRVDQVFASAVDRQVAEQRNLNRMLEDLDRAITGVRGRIDELQAQVVRDIAPTVDRMATLDASVRALRETGSQQSVTLRAELEEGLGALRDEVRGQRELLGDELSSLREVDRSLTERLEAVARTVEGATERLDARQATLAEQLNQVVGRLTDAAEAAETTRAGLAPLGRVEERLEELDRSVQAGVGSRLEQLEVRLQPLAAAVEGVVARLDRLEARETSTGGRLTADLAELSDGVSTSLASMRTGLEDRLGAQGVAIETFARDLRAVLEERLAASDASTEGAVGRVEALAARLGTDLEDLASVTTAMTRARELEEEARDTLRNELTAILRERLDEDLGRLLDRFEVGVAGIRAQVDEQLTGLDARVTGRLDRSDEQQHADLAALGVRVEEAVAAQRDQVTTALAAQRDEVTTALASVRSVLEAGLGGQSERLARELAELRDGVGERLETSLGQVTEQIGGGMRSLEESLEVNRAQLGTLDEAVRTSTGRIETIEEDIARQAGDLGRMAEDVAGVGATIERILGEVRTQLREDQSAALEEVAEVVGEAQQGLVSARDTVEQAMAELLEASEDTQRTVAGAAEQLRAESERTTGAFDEQVAATSATLERQMEAAAAAVEERVDGALLGAEERVAATAEELHERLTDALATISGESRNELTTTRAELHEAAVQLASVTAGLERLESTFVGYLEQRDVRLDRERVALLRDLVEQLADNLSKRERRKLATKLEVPTVPVAPPPAEEPAATTPAPVDEPAPARRTAAAGTPSPARRRGTVRGRSTRGETRARLEAVKGLGPAKVDALMDRFGSLEAIEAAGVDGLVAVRGIGTTLAESILEQLRD